SEYRRRHGLDHGDRHDNNYHRRDRLERRHHRRLVDGETKRIDFGRRQYDEGQQKPDGELHGKGPPPATPGARRCGAGDIERYPENLDQEELYVRRGQRSGLYSIVAVHSTVRGPALGGCRMWSYGDSRAAVRDALRLSRAMTLKAAVANLGLGGGKGVI